MADRRFLEDGGGRAQTLVEAARVLVFVANTVADEACERAIGALAWVNDHRLSAADICGLLALTHEWGLHSKKSYESFGTQSMCLPPSGA